MSSHAEHQQDGDGPRQEDRGTLGTFTKALVRTLLGRVSFTAYERMNRRCKC